ncbi:MAG: nuclear transport factor 2 family protein [Beijerinckiaceae bacterium]
MSADIASGPAFSVIAAAIGRYFNGIYTGDIGALRDVFDPRAQLFGEVRGEPYFRDLDAYLAGVAARKSPESLGEPFAMRVLGIEVEGAMARAIVSVPMLGFNYVDFLSLLRTGDQWRIVAKVFTDVPRATTGEQ